MMTNKPTGTIMSPMESKQLKIAYAGLIVLSLGIFVSVSFSALSHVLLLISGSYFFYKDVIKKEREVKLSLSSWFLLGIVLSIILSVIFNLDIIPRPLKNLSKIKYFLIPWLSVFALNRLNEGFLTKKRIQMLIYLFLGATTVATISGLIGLSTGFNPLKMKDACHATRACGLYGMYMTYGYGISLFAILVSTAVLLKVNIVSRSALYVSAFFGLVGTVFSFARGGWIGYLAGMWAFFVKKNAKAGFIFTIVTLVLLGGALKLSPKVNDMFFKRTGSNQQRLAFYETAYVAFKEKPLFGWGYRNFEPNVKNLKKKYRIAHPYFGGHAHNNLLEHLASTGAFGFLMVLGFFISWAVETYKNRGVLGNLAFPFVLGFLVSGMFQYTFGDGENLFLVMGVWLLVPGIFINLKSS